MVLTEEKKQNLKLCFQSIRKSEGEIDDLNDNISTFRQSIKETFKNVASIMEVDPKDKEGQKAIVKGYEEYIKSITSPDAMSTQDEVFAILKTNDFLGLEKLNEDK